MAPTPLITVEHLTVTYSEAQRPALSDVSLAVFPGDLIGLIGPNGAGKSTLARHLAGLRKPAVGRITIAGRDVAKERVGSFANAVGIVFQSPDAHLTEQSVFDELRVGPRHLGLPQDMCDERVRSVVELLHLHGQGHQHPMLLDLARRRLVALGAALTLAPSVLLLDEPTVGLDSEATALVINVIEQRRQRGEATILISHDLDLVAEQTERAILLNQGQIVVDGKTERVLSDAPTLALADLQPPEATLIARALGLADEERPIVTTSQLTAALLAKLGAYSPSREW